MQAIGRNALSFLSRNKILLYNAEYYKGGKKYVDIVERISKRCYCISTRDVFNVDGPACDIPGTGDDTGADCTTCTRGLRRP